MLDHGKAMWGQLEAMSELCWATCGSVGSFWRLCWIIWRLCWANWNVKTTLGLCWVTRGLQLQACSCFPSFLCFACRINGICTSGTFGSEAHHALGQGFGGGLAGRRRSWRHSSLCDPKVGFANVVEQSLCRLRHGDQEAINKPGKQIRDAGKSRSTMPSTPSVWRNNGKRATCGKREMVPADSEAKSEAEN